MIIKELILEIKYMKNNCNFLKIQAGHFINELIIWTISIMVYNVLVSIKWYLTPVLLVKNVLTQKS